MRKLLLSVLLVAVGGLAQAAVQLRDGYPDHYTVTKGDTLWDISGRFLTHPWEWPQLWHANPEIRNPHLIYPGDVLRLVYIDGHPRLVLERGSRGTIKLSPHSRVRPIAEAIPTIPLRSINSFLLKNRIVDSLAELEAAPYIVAGDSERVVSGPGDRIYGRGYFDPSLAEYGVFRIGKVYTEPETEEVLGVNLDDVGSAELLAVNGVERGDSDVATLYLTRVSQEVYVSDRLLPAEEQALTSTFFPSAPDAAIDGIILDVPRGVTQIGYMDVVILNKGARDGLIEGNVLAVYKTGETVRDRLNGDLVKIPDERAGLLMVFRVYDKLSYGLVLRASRSLKVEDRVTNP